MSRLNLFLLLFLFGLLSATADAAPHLGNVVKLLQPDGTKISARAYGDEFYQRIESMEGYTLIKDPETGWISYAELSSDKSAFVSTGVVYQNSFPSLGSPGIQLAPLGVDPGIQLPLAAVRDIANNNKRLLIIDDVLGMPLPGGSGASSTEYAAPVVGSVVGLTLLIDFPDEKSSFTESDIDDYLNSFGYQAFSNQGSVREYFGDVSNNNLDYTNVIARYYTAKHVKGYYTDSGISFGQRARELIVEALDALEAEGFDFSQLSTNASGEILAINALYAGDVDSAWSVGLWPHKSSLFPVFSADGVSSGNYQITNMGDALSIGTFCHENGHMIFNWPDLYDYDSGLGTTGIGSYGLMAGGALVNGGRSPTPPNPYFRDLVGWESVTEISTIEMETTLSSVANSNNSYKYTNVNNTGEHFWIESRTKSGRNTGLPDEGLLIWHVDANGSNSLEEMTQSRHFMVSVEQADGLFELENMRGANSGDLFHANSVDEFSDVTTPDANWWDGSPSGLAIFNISEVSSVMEFTVGEPGSGDIECNFILVSEWDIGFTAVIRIANRSSAAINTWDVSWSFDDGSVITNSWNAAVRGGNPYDASALEWNRNIAQGGEVEFGIQGNKGIPFAALAIPRVGGTLCN